MKSRKGGGSGFALLLRRPARRRAGLARLARRFSAAAKRASKELSASRMEFIKSAVIRAPGLRCWNLPLIEAILPDAPHIRKSVNMRGPYPDIFVWGLGRPDRLQKASQLRRRLILRNRLQFLECAGECVRQAPHGSRLEFLMHRLKVQLVHSSR